MVLNSFLMIIDRLIALKEGRIKGRKEMFDRIYAPIFSDLVLIHADYLRFLNFAQKEMDLDPETARLAQQMHDERLSVLFEKRRIAPPSALIVQKINESKIECARKTRELLEKERTALEPVRVKVTAFRDVLSQSSTHGEEKAFLESLNWYLPTGKFDEATNTRTRATSIIEALRRAERFPDDFHEIRDYFGVEISTHVSKWSQVCIAFAELKVSVVAQR